MSNISIRDAIGNMDLERRWNLSGKIEPIDCNGNSLFAEALQTAIEVDCKTNSV